MEQLNLDQYDALEIRLQTDGHVYVAQIKPYTPLEEDLYQVIIPPLTPNTWHNVILPFDNFILTWRGYAEEEQQPMRRHSIQHVAILMAERMDGPFWMNIDWIRAIKWGEYEKIRQQY